MLNETSIAKTIRSFPSLYEKAIALDPNFADAHAGYARVAADVWRLGYDNVLASPVARKRAYEAADRALALDANIPRAYSVLGVLQAVEGRYDEAIASAHKAVSLGPNSADAYVNLAVVLMFSGRPTESLTAMETALRLNPKPPLGVYGYYGAVLFINRQYEKAIEPLEKARAASNIAREHLAMTYAQLGRSDNSDPSRSFTQVLRQSWPTKLAGQPIAPSCRSSLIIYLRILKHARAGYTL